MMGSIRQQILHLGICLWLMAGIQLISGLPAKKRDSFGHCGGDSQPQPRLTLIQPGPNGELQIQGGIMGLYMNELKEQGTPGNDQRHEGSSPQMDLCPADDEPDAEQSVHYIKVTALIPVRLKPILDCGHQAPQAEEPEGASPEVAPYPSPLPLPPPPPLPPAPTSRLPIRLYPSPITLPPLPRLPPAPTRRFPMRPSRFPPHGNPYPYPPRTSRPDIMPEGCIDDCP